MSSVNKVILLGRLGQDPELKHLPNGGSVCNFSIATSEVWNDKNSGKKQEKTEWSKVVVWGKQADSVNKYLTKGSQAYVEGKLSTRSWDDKDGNKKYVTEIVANNIQFIGGNADKNTVLEDAHNKAGDKQYTVKTDADFASDDIPF